MLANAGEAVEFISNILESSTEYSIIANAMDGTILLWNEGARRLYGYEAEEVVGIMNGYSLHAPEEVQNGKAREIIEAALRDGKWEGLLRRIRKNGEEFLARVVVTPRMDSSGKPVGILLISKDISEEIRMTIELESSNNDLREQIMQRQAAENALLQSHQKLIARSAEMEQNRNANAAAGRDERSFAILCQFGGSASGCGKGPDEIFSGRSWNDLFNQSTGGLT
jgi:PAS domain S-box-containing protein